MTEEHLQKLQYARYKAVQERRGEPFVTMQQFQEPGFKLPPQKDHHASDKEAKLRKKNNISLVPFVNPTTPREHIVNEINKNKIKILKAQIDESVGLHFIDANGRTVYTRKPNTSMGEYLLNQLIGKPKESIDVKTEVRLNVDI